MALDAFLKGNKKTKGSIKFAASKEFLDEEGKAMEWEIRPLKSREADLIRSECTDINAKGKRVSIDQAKFNRMVAATCTVYPNLNDKELQDSYDVMCAEDLVLEMLDNDGEFQSYVKRVMEVSGYMETEEDLIETAKN